jgi:uncharacterized protein YecE (DUF72 family)
VARGAKKVFIFFNNDFGGYAPQDAKRLVEVLNADSFIPRPQ